MGINQNELTAHVYFGSLGSSLRQSAPLDMTLAAFCYVRYEGSFCPEDKYLTTLGL